MRALAGGFEVVAGERAAAAYTALASRTISRHFRSLRDGVVAQLQPPPVPSVLVVGFVSSSGFHPAEAPHPSAAVARAAEFSFDYLPRHNSKLLLCDSDAGITSYLNDVIVGSSKSSIFWSPHSSCAV